MNIIESFHDKARELSKCVVLPEGADERTLKACEAIIKNKIARLIVLGSNLKLPNSADLEVIDPKLSPKKEEFVNAYYERRKAKGLTLEEAESAMENPVFFGAMLVSAGLADGCVAGAANTTADVLRAGLRVIGTEQGIKTVSSFFIMVTNNRSFGHDGVLVFADCAVNAAPDSSELADIAICTAKNTEKLLGITPITAFLSFSTKGSAAHTRIDVVKEALAITKKRRPELIADGELQLDAALIEDIARRKAKGSPVAGRANVLIFPDLDSGNIGYKLVERFAGARAIGPVIQGFAKPMNDLSRGATPEDIINTVSITAIQTA